jgi:hypothetical protein
MGGQVPYPCRESVYHGGGVLALEPDEHEIAALAFDQGGDVGVGRSGQQMALPVARSSASVSAGRSLIETASTMPPRPYPFLLAWRERRIVRRVRRWAVSSFFSTPRAWTKRLR